MINKNSKSIWKCTFKTSSWVNLVYRKGKILGLLWAKSVVQCHYQKSQCFKMQSNKKKCETEAMRQPKKNKLEALYIPKKKKNSLETPHC